MILEIAGAMVVIAGRAEQYYNLAHELGELFRDRQVSQPSLDRLDCVGRSSKRE